MPFNKIRDRTTDFFVVLQNNKSKTGILDFQFFGFLNVSINTPIYKIN